MPTKLTGKARTLLDILLKSDTPLTATQIVTMDENLNSNTVQSVLRSLLKNKFIEVAEIVYSGNVLCRSYRATDAARNIAVEEFANGFQTLRKSVPVPVIFASLVDDDLSDKGLIDELEQMILEKRRITKKEG